MKVRLAVSLLVFVLVLPRVASAAVKIWDGGGADANWMTKENWVGDVAPVPNVDSLEFPQTAARKTNSNNFPSGSLFLGIHFSGATGSYSLSGNLLVLGGPITSNTSGTHSINFVISTSTGAAMSVATAGGTLLVGQVNLLTDLALSGAGGIDLFGLVNETGNLTKAGIGVTRLTSANTYTGSTTVLDGTLIVNGVQSFSAITMTGGTLGGRGSVGALGAYSGTVSPGTSAGSTSILNARDTTMSQETTFRVELNGSTAGSSFDQLNVVGEVNLGGAVLNSTLGFVPANFAQFTIINNDGTDAVAGTFAGLPQGSLFTIGTRSFTINYAGGTGNDVVLTAGAVPVIVGTVTSAATEAPVPSTSIVIYSNTAAFVTSVQTNAQGFYTSPGLPAGTYFVKALPPSSSGLLGQLYDNLPCPNAECHPTTGTPVALTGVTAPAVNFALPTGGTITGTVTNAMTAAPVASTSITIYSSTGAFVASAFTNAQGVYTTSIGLPTGSYFVKALPPSSSGLLGQLYNNLPCPDSVCIPTSGTPVAVTAPNATTINFALPKGGAITGTVTNAMTGAPVSNTSISIYSSTGAFTASTFTNAQGVYTTSAGLPTGSYFVRALPPSSSGVTGQVYNNLPCHNGSCTVTNGTPVAVTAPNATTINFALPVGGTITGTVTNATTLAPVPSVTVRFYSSAGVFIETAVTNAQGVYTSPTLQTGSYFVLANPSSSTGLVAQLYSNIPCPGTSCSIVSGTAVAAEGPNATANINFPLVPAPPAPNDTFATALVIDSVPYQSIVNTTTATTSAEDPVVSCGNDSTQKSVWYVLTPAGTGPVSVNTFGSNYDTILAIYTGSPGTFTPLGCNDDTTGVQSALTVQATGGQRLAILVTSYGGSGGVLALNVTAANMAPEPGAFSKISPWNGMTARPSAVTLRWGASTFATAYEYCIDTSNNNVCDAIWVSVGNATSVGLTGLALNTQHYWHVRAVNASGTTYAQDDASAFWTFTGRLPMIRINTDGRGDVFTYDLTAGTWLQRLTQLDGSFVTFGHVWSPGWDTVSAIFDPNGFLQFFRFNTTTGQWTQNFFQPAGYVVRASGSWWPGWERHVMDLDGDGLSDLFLYDPATGAWFKAFSTPTGFTYEQGAWNPGWEVHPMRLNDDAFEDMFLFNRTTGRWFWVLGEAGAGFSYPASGTWLPGWQLYPGDFNGDGLSDLFLNNSAAGEYYVAFNNGADFTYVAGFGWAPGWTPYVANLDADARDDLFLHNAATGAWFQMISDGAGNFTNVGGQQWVLGWDLYLSDFNGDGRADFLLYNPATGEWYMARNLVNGTFSYTNGAWAPGLKVITRGPIR